MAELESFGDEIWIARTQKSGALELTRHAADFSVLSRATARKPPPDAHVRFAFAGTMCAITVGRGASLARCPDDEVEEVLRLGKSSKAKLAAFGPQGFTFLSQGGGVQCFDLEGKPRLEIAGEARDE